MKLHLNWKALTLAVGGVAGVLIVHNVLTATQAAAWSGAIVAVCAFLGFTEPTEEKK